VYIIFSEDLRYQLGMCWVQQMGHWAGNAEMQIWKCGSADVVTKT